MPGAKFESDLHRVAQRVLVRFPMFPKQLKSLISSENNYEVSSCTLLCFPNRRPNALLKAILRLFINCTVCIGVYH